MKLTKYGFQLNLFGFSSFLSVLGIVNSLLGVMAGIGVIVLTLLPKNPSRPICLFHIFLHIKWNRSRHHHHHDNLPRHVVPPHDQNCKERYSRHRNNRQSLQLYFWRLWDFRNDLCPNLWINWPLIESDWNFNNFYNFFGSLFNFFLHEDPRDKT